MIKGSSDFMEGSSSLYVTSLPDLVSIGIVVVEICSSCATWRHVTACSKCCVTSWVEASQSHHFAKFGCRRPCCNRDITDLIVQVTLQDHLIKWLCKFIEEAPPKVAMGIIVMDI